METNQKSIQDFNKQYQINDRLSKKFVFIDAKNKINSSSIAGKPKNMGVEIIKRFFSNPIVIISVILFAFILITSLVVPAASVYTANKPILGKEIPTLEGLPPLYSPIIDRPLATTDTLYKQFMSFEELRKTEPQIYGKPIFDFFYNSYSHAFNEGSIKFVYSYNPYTLFQMQEFVKAIQDAQKAGEQITNAKLLAIKSSLTVFHTYLGTSVNGYDVWTTTWYATWRAIKMSIIITTIQAVIGISIGAFLGFHVGKVIDTVIMRAIEIFNSPPTIVWILIFASILGTGEWTLIIALSIVGWPGFVGVTRRYMITVKNEEYITAAKAIGVSKPRQIFVHGLPAIIGKLANSYVKSIPGNIMWIASLAFLKFYEEKNDTNLGQLLIQAASQDTGNVWLILLPTLILLGISLSLNFIALGLHDALDPKVIRGRKK